MTSGVIFDIKRFALHDGPGIRTTVFLKGCPLSCLGCHNPEGQRAGPELLFLSRRCTNCGDCLPACPHDAILLGEKGIEIDPGRCQLTGACVAACLPGALELAGGEWALEEVLNVLEADRIYFDESGGGVTLSGGEPFSQPDFLAALLLACRERDLSVIVDTCGHVEPGIFRELAPLADGLLFDLKLMDAVRHEAYTGVHNRWILDNLRWAGEGPRAPGVGRPSLTVRLPLIPGINDYSENLQASAGFLGKLGRLPPVDILPYHRLGVDKYGRAGREYGLPELQPPGKSVIHRAVEILEGDE